MKIDKRKFNGGQRPGAGQPKIEYSEPVQDITIRVPKSDIKELRNVAKKMRATKKINKK